MAVYQENVNYVPEVAHICGAIKTDGIAYQTVRMITPTIKVFPVITDKTNTGMSTVTGTQPRNTTADTTAAVQKAVANDKSIRKNLNTPF